MLTEYLLVLLIMLMITAFFSGSEIAFVVSNKLKLEVKARKNNLAAKNAFYFVKNPQDFFSTVIIGNSIVNVAFASISTLILTSLFGLSDISILIISTLLLLLFGELIPKYFAREMADSVLLIASLPIRAMSFLLYPFIKITKSISSFLTQSSTGTEERINYLFNKEDIEFLVEESLNAGVVNKSESNIISKVLELSDQKVYDVMRPRHRNSWCRNYTNNS